MSRESPLNLVASAKQRLLNLSKLRKEDPNAILVRYAVERFLYRLSKSSQADSFLLKGAMLFLAWTDVPYRTTMDVDLLGRGEDSEDAVRNAITRICETHVEPDGLVFDSSTIRIEEIRENQVYFGRRVRLVAHLGKARITVQIDVGFGDAASTRKSKITFPTLLDMPAPRLLAYSQEEVVAEKFHAMVALGMPNSRMKDFYDVWVLARDFGFDGNALSPAISATFARRGTDLPPDVPLALTEEFADDDGKRTQWRAFLSKGLFKTSEEDFGKVIAFLGGFLGPPIRALHQGTSFDMMWPAGGPWTELAR